MKKHREYVKGHVRGMTFCIEQVMELKDSVYGTAVSTSWGGGMKEGSLRTLDKLIADFTAIRDAMKADLETKE